MSTDQSNNNMSESSEESTPSMETVDFFQYIIDSTRDRHSQNNMSNALTYHTATHAQCNKKR